MMIIAALFETLGIGLIVPFVSIVTNAELIQENGILSYIYQLLNFSNTTEFIVFSALFLLGVFIVKNLYLLVFNYVQYHIILNQQVKLSRRLFKDYLTKPYTFHLQRNTSELLRNVNDEVPRVFQGIIVSAFQLFTEILVIICIAALLLMASPMATVTASIFLGGGVFVFFVLMKKKIKDLGVEQQAVSGAMIKWVNQGLGASKEVKVSGKGKFFIEAYTKQSQTMANNNKYMKMLDVVPRLFIETMLVTTVLITMIIIVFQGTNTAGLVSTMALFAMAAFRLMPSITRVVSFITVIKYSQPALQAIHEDLFDNTASTDDAMEQAVSLPVNKNERVFKEAITLDRVSFRYPEQKAHAIKDLSLKIPIGKSVAFIGESGAGKTTLADIILGLFEPESGKVLVDGKELASQRAVWQQKIGYIPQAIFLSDDTIRNNIAFGVDRDLIDDMEVWKSLEQAQLKEFVQALPDGLDTMVGERGVRLSGGQRQRIGIARSLYHNPEILFMDEATSALDNETENEIMKAIDSLKNEKTLIIIAHRLSTIENCDIVYKLSNGKIKSIENKPERVVM